MASIWIEPGTYGAYVAATSNLTLSGAQTIDGVAVTDGKIVLCTAQNTASQNGLYICRVGAWDRIVPLTSGQEWTVSAGNAGAGRVYQLTTGNPIVLGTTSLTIALASGGGVGAHATTHQNGGADVLTSHATGTNGLVWSTPAGVPGGPTFRLLALSDLPAEARTTYVEACITGTIAGLTALYMGPGTVADGLGAPQRLMHFALPFGGSGAWSLDGSFGILGTAAGGMNTFQVTILKSTNGGATWANTSNTFSINGAATTGSDVGNSVSFANGDAIGVRVDSSGAAANLSLTLVIRRIG